jgi:predicted Zn-dependent protease
MLERQRTLYLAFLGPLLFSFLTPFITFAIDNQQIQVGNYADQYFVRTNVFLYNDAVTKRIEKLGNRVVQGAQVHYPDVLNVKFTFRVINSPEINAYSTSGGSVYVTTGLLDSAESEDEVAAVIAHEIVHILKNDFIEKLKALDQTEKALGAFVYIVGTFGGAVLGASLASSNVSPATAAVGTLGAIGGSLGVAFTAAMISKTIAEGYSQNKEFEADKEGVKISSSAGYNPRAIIGFFKRVQYIQEKEQIMQNKKYVSHLIKAKPGLKSRIERLEEVHSSLGNKQ